MGKWISVIERLPESGSHCIGYQLTHGVSTVYFEDGKWEDCFGFAESPVTHWMPLPEPPK